MIYRRIHLGSDRKIDELKLLALLSVGKENGTSHLVFGEVELKDGNAAIGEMLRAGDELRLEVENPSGRTRKNGIALYIKIESLSDEEGKDSKIGDMPFVTDAIGYNLAPEVWDIASNNYIQYYISEGESYVADNGEYYSRSKLEYSGRKMENAIRRHFAPGTERKELNWGVTMTFAQLLSKFRVDELKDAFDVYRVYYYTGMKKAGIIADLCRRLDRKFIEDFFEEMELGEYYAFRQLVTSEESPSSDDSQDYAMNGFRKRLLFNVIPKAGPRLATEVLEYYDEWYDTDKEAEFIREKYFQTALKAASILYGTFDKEMYIAVAGQLTEEISEGAASNYFDSVLAGHGPYRLAMRTLRDRVLYSEHELDKKTADVVYDLQSHEPGAFFLPDREELVRISTVGIGFNAEDEKSLIKLISENSYSYTFYYDDDPRSVYRSVVKQLRVRGDADASLDIAVRGMSMLRYSYRNDPAKTKAAAIISKEAKMLPLMSLNGYARKGCPKAIREHADEALERLKEAQKKRSRTGARTTTARAVTARKRR